MKIKRVELNNFKRFSHLIVEDLSSTTKLVILIGQNGSGKTSFLESMNHYYKYSGFLDVGDCEYLSKAYSKKEISQDEWYANAVGVVNIDFHDVTFPKTIGQSDIKGHFYFRSAYRNEPDFSVRSMERQDDPTYSLRLSTLIQNDLSVSKNYQRLVANTISGVFDSENSYRLVGDLRDELSGKISNALSNIFDDLEFSSLGNPLFNGNFYFSKGESKDFQYKNLSAGEKAAFDLILDMVVQSEYYQDAIYCIDEPEVHMHTKLQSKVLRELYNLVPNDSQLWISTHSIGMLQEAEEIEKEMPGSVAFLDFGGRNFDQSQVIRPNKINKAVLEKFYELAFGDFARLILPSKIVFCEGNHNGNTRKDFDKTVYSTIFENSHPDALFISGGSCSQIENIEEIHGAIISALLENSEVIRVIDRDDRSTEEIRDLNKKGIKVLQRRNIESYLFDDSMIRKLCESVGRDELYDACIKAKQEALSKSIERGNSKDDYKSARGDIYNSLKTILQLTGCGNNMDSFLRDTMAPLMTSDMEIYKQLDNEIFG